GGAADAKQNVVPGVPPRDRDGTRDVAVGNQPDACTRFATFLDDVGVAVAFEDDGRDVAHALAQSLGDGFEVRLYRRVQVDDIGGSRAGADLLHVERGTGVEHRAPLAHRDHGDRAAAAERRQGGAVDRVDGDVHVRRRAVPDLLAVEEHRRVVFFALADD